MITFFLFPLVAGAVVFDDVIVSAFRSQNGHTEKIRYFQEKKEPGKFAVTRPMLFKGGLQNEKEFRWLFSYL